MDTSAQASALTALSPVDGRYAATVAPLREYFSEAALIRERIRVEALWFLQLGDAAAMRAGALPAAGARPRRRAGTPARCRGAPRR